MIIPERLVDKYIEIYNENHALGVKEIDGAEKVISYEYGKRKCDTPSGVILGTRRRNGKLTVYQTDKLHHVLVNSSTGLGKTQGFVLSSLFNADGKTSIIVTDPKGELASLSYGYLCSVYGRENVGILNFRDPSHTEYRYNPFKELAEQYRRAENLPYSKKNREIEAVMTKLQILIGNMFPIRTINDASWDIGARDLIFAIMFGLIEDTVKNRNGREISPREVTIGNAIKVFSEISWHSDSVTFGDKGFFSQRPESSVAKQRAKTVLCASQSTRTSYLSLVNSFFEPYFNPKILNITSEHTVDVISMSKRPKILFVIYNIADEGVKKLVNDFAVNSLTQLTDEYCKAGGPLDVPVIFLCDEFSSLAPNDVYPNILSIGRGMNIFLHLIIQSTAQLRAAYKDKADILTENFGVKFFLGTNNYETAKEFVTEVGDSFQLSRADLTAGKIAFSERPRISAEKLLYGMTPGECYAKTVNSPPIHTSFEMYYKTEEFNKIPSLDLSTISVPLRAASKSCRNAECVTEETAAERCIHEARQALEKRKQEILKKIITESEKKTEEKRQDDNDDDGIELCDVIDCISPLSDNELDILGIAIKGGEISEASVKRDFVLGDMEPMDIINRFLKLGIVKKKRNGKYIFAFSEIVFKKARKTLAPK